MKSNSREATLQAFSIAEKNAVGRWPIPIFVTRLIVVYLISLMIKGFDMTFGGFLDLTTRGFLFTVQFVGLWIMCWYLAVYVNKRLQASAMLTKLFVNIAMAYSAAFLSNWIYRLSDLLVYAYKWESVSFFNPEYTISLLLIYMLIYGYNESYRANRKIMELQGMASGEAQNNSPDSITDLYFSQPIPGLRKPRSRKRLLVKSGDKYLTLNCADIAYFMFEEGLNFAYDFKGKRYPVDDGISELEKQLDPESFFRVNRKFLVNINAIKLIRTWLNSRLQIELSAPATESLIVSRERVRKFKEWLNG